jgi:hypothetical protein
MTERELVNILYLTTSMVALHVLSEITGKHLISRICLILALISSIAAVACMTYVSGHVPVSGDFEKYQNIAMFMLLFAVMQNIFQPDKQINNPVNGFIVLIFLLLIFPGKKTVAENYIIYSKVDVVMFFQLRMLAMAMFAHAISLYISAWVRYKSNKVFLTLKHQARNFTLLGAAAFLGGEFFGSVWALYGWGDPWRWSRGFFLAGAMFLLSMLAVHIPPVYMRKKSLQVILSSLPLIVIVVSFIL